MRWRTSRCVDDCSIGRAETMLVGRLLLYLVMEYSFAHTEVRRYVGSRQKVSSCVVGWDESLVECRTSEAVAFGLTISRGDGGLGLDGCEFCDGLGSPGCRQTGRGKFRRRMECFDFLECCSSRPERLKFSLNSCQISVQHGTLGLGDGVKSDSRFCKSTYLMQPEPDRHQAVPPGTIP